MRSITGVAEARNKALAGFGDEPLDWLVVIDVDIYAKPLHVWQLIEVVKARPGVAMACASALQNVPDIFGRSPWSYYDSYALLDHHNWLGITGALIPLRDLQDRAKWIAGAGASSCCLQWYSRAAYVYRSFSASAMGRCTGCEHWSFCLEASAVGVVACPQVAPLVIRPATALERGISPAPKHEQAALETSNRLSSLQWVMLCIPAAIESITASSSHRRVAERLNAFIGSCYSPPSPAPFGDWRKPSQVRIPVAPARWTTALSELMRRSQFASTATLSLKSIDSLTVFCPAMKFSPLPVWHCSLPAPF